MAYGIDMKKSAHRHLEAARSLDQPSPSGRRDAAAYLYGLAAECALKQIMLHSGLQRPQGRRDGPFYAHFPELKTLLRDALQGRLQRGVLEHGRLQHYAADQALLREWDIAIRYAPTADILDKPLNLWAEQASRLVAAMNEV